MKTVKVQQAKTHLSAILTEVEGGEEYVIARADKPVARLVAIEYDDKRPLGFVNYPVPDSFFDALPIEELNAWEG